MISGKEIQDFILKHWLLHHHCPYVVHNFHAQGYHEADVLVVSKNLMVTEFEIKMSRSDFFADFKKDHKHQLLSGLLFSNFSKAPNRFYYAVPKGLIREDEVPEYAGLIYFNKFTLSDRNCAGKTFVEFQVMKKAPRIHKIKATNEMLLKIASIHSYRLTLGCALLTYRNRENKRAYAEE